MKKLLRVFLFTMVLVLLTVSCSKKKTKVAPKPVKPEPVKEKIVKVDKPQLTEEQIFQQKSLDQINSEGHLKRVNFDFDKYNVKEDMKPIIQRNADWLMKHKSVEISLQGHCDERGTVEYNVALGEKRADNVKTYLVSLGVSSNRINVVSFGKSKPLVRGNSEEANYQNRRVEFVITKK